MKPTETLESVPTKAILKLPFSCVFLIAPRLKLTKALEKEKHLSIIWDLESYWGSNTTAAHARLSFEHSIKLLEY